MSSKTSQATSAAHTYAFTFESRRKPYYREHVHVPHYNWRSAQTIAITKVAVKTKTPRHVWRMIYMERM